MSRQTWTTRRARATWLSWRGPRTRIRTFRIVRLLIYVVMAQRKEDHENNNNKQRETRMTWKRIEGRHGVVWHHNLDFRSIRVIEMRKTVLSVVGKGRDEGEIIRREILKIIRQWQEDRKRSQ
jgi:hypothetical protein